MAKQNTKETVNLAEKEAEALRKGKAIREDYSRTTDILIKKQNQLNDLQAKQNELEKDSLKNQNEIIENKQKISKTQLSIEVTEEKILRLEEKAKKNQEELKKYREEREESEKQTEKRNVQAERVEKRLLDLKRGTNVEMNLSADLMSKIGGSAAELSKISGVSNSLFEQQTNILAQSENILKSQGFLTEDFVRSLEDGKTITQDISSLEAEILSQTNEASVGKYKSVDLSRQETLLKRKLVELQDESSDLTGEEKDQAILLVKSQQDALANLKDKNKQLGEMSKQSEKTLGVFEKFSSFDFKGGLRQYFGLDQLKSDMKDKLGKTVLEVTQAVRGPQGLVGGFKAAASGLGGMIKMAPKLALGLGVMGIAAGFAALGKMVMHADEEIANMGKELGVSHHEAALLHGETQKMASSMNIVGLNAKEVYEGVKIVGDAMGGIDIGAQLAAGNKEIEGFVKQASVLSKEFGLSGEEISQIKNLATLTGKSMDDLVKESVELGKGTMTAKQTLKVLSTIPPEVSVAFKGSTKELIAAAQKAKLLGMELGKVHGIGQGMLEIEDSLGKEMEARVLTGKNLNLDAARMYALQGDTFKLQEEILNQAGSLEDFTKMNTIQQDSMAKALGMSVEEMTKMLTNAEKLKKADISSDYAERLQAMESAADLEKEAAGARSKEQKDYIMQLAAEKRSASLKEKMADMMEKIKAKLAPIVERIVAMAHSLFDSTKGASMFDDILAKIDIEEIIHGVKESLPKIMEAIKGLIQNLPKIISFVSGLVEKFAGAGGALGGIVGMLNPSIAGFGMLALKVGGPGGIAKGFEFAFKGAGKLFDVVKGPLSEGVGKLGDSVTGKLGGAFGKVADKAKDGLGSVMEKMGKVKTPPTPKGDGGGGFMKSLADGFKKINTTDLIKAAVALAILAGALWITAKAMQEFNTVNFDAFLMGVGALFALAGVALILGKLKTSILEGSLAMLVMAGALYVLGAALLQFNDVDWPSLGKAALAIVGLTAAIFGLGALIAGPGAIIFGLGVAGFMALGVAAGVLGLGLQVLGNGIASIGGGIESLFKQMEKLYDMDPEKFEMISDKIGILGKAISDIGSGALTSAIGGGLSALFGTKSPIDQVSEIMTKLDASKLDGTSAAIRSLADAFKYFAEETTKLKDFDTDKLDTIIEKMKEVQEAEAAGSMSKAVTGVATAVSGFITNLFGSSEEQKSQPVSAGGATGAAVNTGGGTNMANVEKKLDTLISVLSQAANQPLVIKFGEKTIEEIKSQLSLRKATDIGVNKGYAKTI